LTTYCTDRNFFDDPDFFSRNRARLTDEPNVMRSANGKPPPPADDPEDENALRSIDLRALLELHLPPPEFVVEHLFPRRAVVLIGGDSGSGKSSFVTHAGLATCLETLVGERFKPIAGAKVLYLNAEVDPSLIQRSVLQSLAGLGTTADAFPWNRWEFVGEQGFSEICLAPGATGENEKRRFEAKLATFRPDIVVLDTHRAIFAVDDKDNALVSIGLNWLKVQAIKYNCCIVVVHHMRKLSAGSNSTRERITGAAAFREIPGVVLGAVSENGLPMTALNVDKTRFALDDVQTGKTFPVSAIFEPPRTLPDGTISIGSSGFVIHAPTAQPPEQSTAEAKADETAARNPKSARMIAARAKGIMWAKAASKAFTVTELGIAIGGSAKIARAASASLITDKTMLRDKSTPGTRYRLSDLKADGDPEDDDHVE
jgi:hypothetical protein